MRIDKGTIPPARIYEAPYELLNLRHYLELFVHPRRMICTQPDASVIAAIQACRQAYGMGEIHTYYHPDERKLALVCYCNCIGNPCEEFFSLNPHCHKPDQFDPKAATVIDIYLPPAPE